MTASDHLKLGVYEFMALEFPGNYAGLDGKSPGGAPWPDGFLDEAGLVISWVRGELMIPEVLASVQRDLYRVIQHYQRRGELGTWVGVVGGEVRKGFWAVTIVDGIDRPSFTITLSGGLLGARGERFTHLAGGD